MRVYSNKHVCDIISKMEAHLTPFKIMEWIGSPPYSNTNFVQYKTVCNADEESNWTNESKAQ